MTPAQRQIFSAAALCPGLHIRALYRLAGVEVRLRGFALMVLERRGLLRSHMDGPARMVWPASWVTA